MFADAYSTECMELMTILFSVGLKELVMFREPIVLPSILNALWSCSQKAVLPIACEMRFLFHDRSRAS